MYVPIKEIIHQVNDQPEWFNKQAQKLTTKHRKTYNLYKKTGDPFYLNKYRSERRESKKKIKIIRRQHLTNKICKPLEKGNSKPFFKYLRQFNNSVPSLTLKDYDGSIVDDAGRCAEILNSFFQQQFTDQHTLAPKEHVTMDANVANFEITENGVEKLLKSLPNGKSPGPDGLRKSDLLIDIASTSSCLTLIYRASILAGKLPSQWKVANVTPIHKAGDRDIPNNYRPISLTSIACKMLEHIVLHYLNEELDNILHNRQHGFRQGMSCDTQLCATYNDLARSKEVRKPTHAVVLDFKKAFDKVPHKLLMEKIGKLQLHPQIVDWIHDFLCNRKQRVVICGQSSSEKSVTSGVPQGSVLGPTLFLIYINDLPDVLTCGCSLYADDTLVYQEVTTAEQEAEFQRNISAVYQWSKQWQMPFNEGKSQLLLFGETSTSTAVSYKLGNTTIKRVEETKYLGVILQQDLCFDSHIDSKIASARKLLGAIKFMLHDASIEGKTLAYTSLCRPILEYADVVWDPVCKQAINSLEKVQTDAVKFIANLRGRTSITEARERLGLELLSKRRRNHRLSLLNKILSNESKHSALASAYDEISQDRVDYTMTTRSQTRGELNSISATSKNYHNSFLPRTIRDIRQ